MTKDRLIKTITEKGFLKTPEIIKAFQKIDRADFVRPEKLSEAYEDYPLPIGNGATISQPSTVAFMLENLQPKKGDKVLDIGSGSGWTTALLAEIIGSEGKVYGIEIVPELVEFGQKNLKKYKFNNASINHAEEGRLGLPKHAPYDKILISAAAEKKPYELTEQLKTGGNIIVPVISSIWKMHKVSEDKIKEEEFSGFNFVPLK
ncbi:MAG: protein-L-isoaspartate O-methyltransferase [Candidatus Spechtbacterales bacterium]|nr:protein-L-isoaspartate O-methyltransferase [Candidatus Spechtbacterales bacterium]